MFRDLTLAVLFAAAFVLAIHVVARAVVVIPPAVTKLVNR